MHVICEPLCKFEATVELVLSVHGFILTNIVPTTEMQFGLHFLSTMYSTHC